MTLLSYVKGLWTALLPAATKAKMENIEDGIKNASDILDLETDAGRAITQAADAAAQRSALGLGDSAIKDVGIGAGDVAAGDAPAAAQAAAEATAAGALAGHVAALDPHTQYAKEADLGDSAGKNVGTTAGTVAAGNAPAGAVTSHESTYAHANLPTAAGKTAADAIGAATGATTALKLANLTSPASEGAKGVVQLASIGVPSATKVPKALGADLVALITAAGFSLSPATGADNLDNIADGTNHKRLTAGEKIYLNGLSATQQKPGWGLMRTLAEGINSPSLVFFGDSTGNETTEYPYLIAQKIKTEYPNINVKYKLYNSATGEYDAEVDVGTPAGGDRHILVAGTGSTFMLSSSDIVRASGDLELRLCIDLDSWAADGLTKTLLSNYTSESGGKGFWLYLDGAQLKLVWSPDGTATKTYYGPTLSAYTPGTKYWLKITLDVDNGSGGYTVTTYESSNGSAWTQIHQSVTTAGTTAVFQPSSVRFYIASIDGSTFLGRGKYYHIEIRDGINGPDVLLQPIESWRRSGALPNSASIAGTPTLYIYNGCVSGYSIDNVNSANLVSKIMPILTAPLIFIGIGHNDSTQLNLTYANKWAAFLALLRARSIVPHICIMTENPQFSPATRAFEMSVRRRLLMSIGRNNNIDVIDTYGAFLADGRALTDLINSVDGVHPLAAGSELIKDTIWTSFQ